MVDGFQTQLTRKLGIKYPIMCAGMGHVTGAELAAAVSNAGGIGTIGAIGLSPDGCRQEIRRLKSMLHKGNSIAGTVPFGVDLLLPKLGGNARKTNKDYTGGQLGALVDVMVEEKVPLFVCAVGVPPQWVSDKLHEHGIVIMNMAGAPKHVKKALSVGVDIICATGGEGGAHSGDISSMVLIPQCADICKAHNAILVGGGGIFDGRGIAACMALGAQGVWVGTRFLSSLEANCNVGWHKAILQATSNDTRRIEIYTGRPLRVIKNKYNNDWARREPEMRALLAKGTIPVYQDMADGKLDPKKFFGGPLSRHAQGIGKRPEQGYWNDVREDKAWQEDIDCAQAGQAIGAIHSIPSAAALVKSMMEELVAALQTLGKLGGQVPPSPNFKIAVPPIAPLTLSRL
jgi:NAD(P)H-dependent flavin oxidoreductase YrpB (nitropropane dioxygenase family)